MYIYKRVKSIVVLMVLFFFVQQTAYARPVNETLVIASKLTLKPATTPTHSTVYFYPTAKQSFTTDNGAELLGDNDHQYNIQVVINQNNEEMKSVSFHFDNNITLTANIHREEMELKLIAHNNITDFTADLTPKNLEILLQALQVKKRVERDANQSTSTTPPSTSPPETGYNHHTVHIVAAISATVLLFMTAYIGYKIGKRKGFSAAENTINPNTKHLAKILPYNLNLQNIPRNTLIVISKFISDIVEVFSSSNDNAPETMGVDRSVNCAIASQSTLFKKQLELVLIQKL